MNYSRIGRKRWRVRIHHFFRGLCGDGLGRFLSFLDAQPVSMLKYLQPDSIVPLREVYINRSLYSGYPSRTYPLEDRNQNQRSKNHFLVPLKLKLGLALVDVQASFSKSAHKTYSFPYTQKYCYSKPKKKMIDVSSMGKNHHINSLK